MFKNYHTILLLICLLHQSTTQCMDANNPEPAQPNAFQRLMAQAAKEIPPLCASLVQELMKQPFFEGTNCWRNSDLTKVLPLVNEYDGKITQALSESSYNPNDAKWQVNTLSIWSPCMPNSGPAITNGLCLTYYNSNVQPDNQQELEKKYADIIHQIQNGWTAATLKQYPKIFFTQPEDKWDLFIKQQKLPREDDMIQYLANKLGYTSDQIQCFDHWCTKPGVEKGMLYLWVKKESTITEKDTHS
jgi:hypothetical protein